MPLGRPKLLEEEAASRLSREQAAEAAERVRAAWNKLVQKR